jgi:fatty acid desaturase
MANKERRIETSRRWGSVSVRSEIAGDSRHITWYRTPLDRETLARLNTRSDLKGFLQALGHLGLLLSTGSVALSAAGNWPWWTVLLVVFLHGTVASFAINAVHELVHKSVFRTPWLHDMFVRVFAFIGWINYPHFSSSHVRHHQYTLHPPDDLEVVLPIRLMVKDFFRRGFLNAEGFLEVFKITIRHSRGRFEGEWETALFPAAQPWRGRSVIRWARTLLVGHGLILVVSLSLGWWLLPVLMSLAPFYGGWLFFLCNNTQHIGLRDNVPDFRLCCRTFILNPVVGFLYWHMNYHTEHHMFAAVPCYNLGELHRAIVHDLPPCPRGIVATWKEIAAIQMKQHDDPAYQYMAPLPGQ